MIHAERESFKINFLVFIKKSNLPRLWIGVFNGRVMIFISIDPEFILNALHSCTAFLCLLIELFGTSPSPADLTGVAIDRGLNFAMIFIHPQDETRSVLCCFSLIRV